jgi:hypothetical protein
VKVWLDVSPVASVAVTVAVWVPGVSYTLPGRSPVAVVPSSKAQLSVTASPSGSVA